jgi:hypothetical protein
MVHPAALLPNNHQLPINNNKQPKQLPMPNKPAINAGELQRHTNNRAIHSHMPATATTTAASTSTSATAWWW